MDAGFDFIDIDRKFPVQLSASLCVGLFRLSISVLVVALFVEFFLEGVVWMFKDLVDLSPAVEGAANLFHGEFPRASFVEVLTNTTA